MLVPVTDEARAALGNKDEIRMTRFPLNVGRKENATHVDAQNTSTDFFAQ